MFGRKLICVKCGLIVAAKNYPRNLPYKANGGECSHLFFDKRDRVGISIGLDAVAKGRR